MEEKIKRFVELSVEFTISSDVIYPTGYNNNTFSISAGSGCIVTGLQSTFTKEPTRLERFEKFSADKVEKAKRYEEYLELQKDLAEYYKIVDKLNK